MFSCTSRLNSGRTNKPPEFHSYTQENDKMLGVASFISLFSSVPVLTAFQMFHLQELVFCSASCRQANRLVKGKRILKQK